MTTTPAGRVLDTAIKIAAAAPKTKNASAFAAQIPWHLVQELREGLDALEIDWRS